MSIVRWNLRPVIFGVDYSISEAQTFAENRRKPQSFAENGLSDLVCPFQLRPINISTGKSQRAKTQRVKTSENFAEEKNVRRRFLRR